MYHYLRNSTHYYLLFLISRARRELYLVVQKQVAFTDLLTKELKKIHSHIIFIYLYYIIMYIIYCFCFPISQVHAIDSDDGENGRISYSIKSGKGKNKFRIDSQRGHIYIAKPLESDNEFEIHIKAEDNGMPKKSQTARVNIVVVPVNPNSQAAPLIVKKSSDNVVVDLTENDKPGFLVTQVLAVDEDNDQLWYNISSKLNYSFTLQKFK